MSERGSYSVEAALIMPFTIFLLTGIIYLSLFLHDSILLKSLAGQAASEAANYVIKEINPETGNVNFIKLLNRPIWYRRQDMSEEKRDEIIRWTGKLIGNKLLITKVKRIEVNTRSSLVQMLLGCLEIKVDIFAETALPVKGLRFLFTGASGLDVHAKGIFHGVNPLDQFLDFQPE